MQTAPRAAVGLSHLNLQLVVVCATRPPTSSSTLLLTRSIVSSTLTLISIKGSGKAAVAVELRRVQVLARRGPDTPLLLLLGPLLLLCCRLGRPVGGLARAFMLVFG